MAFYPTIHVKLQQLLAVEHEKSFITSWLILLYVLSIDVHQVCILKAKIIYKNGSFRIRENLDHLKTADFVSVTL